MNMRPLRSDLFRKIALAFSLIILIFSFAVYQFIILPDADRLAETEMDLTSEDIRHTIIDFFDDSERQLYQLRDYAVQGFFSSDNAVDFYRFAMPLLKRNNAYYIFRVAREDSREIILFKEKNGWDVRLSFPEKQPGLARWNHWDLEGNPGNEVTIPSDYDCRSRPWFQGAMTVSPESSTVFWTTPYLFLQNQEPGISASLRYRNNDGTRHVLSLGMRIVALSSITQNVKLGKSGFVTLFDAAGSIVALPGEQAPAASSPLSDGKILNVQNYPVISTLHEEWNGSGLRSSVSFRRNIGGVEWIARFVPVRMGAHHFHLGLFVPVADFAADKTLPLTALGLGLFLALVLAAVFAGHLSGRISRPLLQLVAGSRQLGSLNFSPLQMMPTHWREINELSLAQDEMRRQIAEASINLEEKIHQRTLALQKFSSAIEQSPVSVIITDVYGNIEYVNPHFFRLTGYTGSDVTGRNPRLLQSGQTSADTYAGLWQTLTAGRFWQGEFINKRKDGTLFTESAVITPIRNSTGAITHYVAVKEDITARKKHLKEIDDQLSLINQLIDAVPNPLFYKDANRRFIGCNKAYEAAFGIGRDKLVGKTLLDLQKVLTQEERAFYHEEDLNLIQTNGSAHHQLRVSFKDETIRDVLYWASGFQLSDGSPGGMIGLIIDISDMAKKEEELRHARQDAEEATRAKSMFLANMSHEIRTPMNAIIGLSYLALKTELTDKQYDYLSKINNASTLLLGIINDILDFSKIEADKLQLDSIGFSLDEVMDGVFNLTKAQAQTKGLEFFSHMDPDIPQRLLGDPLRLSQIMTNLINNAIKFTTQGSVSVSGQIAGRAGNRIELQFSIADTGIGMSPEQSDKLFQAFTQADGSTTRKYGGTGLGLTISKQLIERMGGSIRVDSSLGIGATFTFTAWFTLPEEKLESRRIVPQTLNNLRVLVADDNQAARDVLSEYLKDMTFRVDSVSSGQSALDAVLQCCESDPYDLVLMDWKMPGMDGLEAARRIKSHPAVSHVPAIIVVTAYDRKDIRSEIIRNKLEGLLIKPVLQSTLLNTVLRLFIDNSPESLHPSENREDNYGLTGLRVLLVEDNDINQQIAVELLKSQGIHVTVANDGSEAVEKVSHGDEPAFDLILMDLQMPNMDGFEATALIRGHFANLPVIAMTARAMVEEKEQCIAVGMNDHVAKPIDPQLLFTTIARWAPKGRIVSASPETPASAPGPSLELDFRDISGLDSVIGLKRVLGNEKLYCNLLQQYVRGQAKTIPRIRQALEKEDMISVTSIAHSLKGVSANIGAHDIAQIAAAIEKASRNPGPGNILPPLLDALEKDFASLSQAIQTRFPDISPACSPDSHQPLSDSLAEKLRQLADLLADSDSLALDRFEELRPELALTVPYENLRELENRISGFEWESARNRVVAWLKGEFSDGRQKPGHSGH